MVSLGRLPQRVGDEMCFILWQTLYPPHFSRVAAAVWTQPNRSLKICRYNMTEYNAHGSGSEALEIYLLTNNKESPGFNRQFVSFHQLDPPHSISPQEGEGSLKGRAGCSMVKVIVDQPTSHKHCIWEAQLWNVHSSTMEDPAWRLRLEIWLNSSSPCISKDCPIKTPFHSQGRYLHEGQMIWEMSSPFGSSNPAPEIWDAEARIKGGNHTEADQKLVKAFIELHVGQGDFGPI